MNLHCTMLYKLKLFVRVLYALFTMYTHWTHCTGNKYKTPCRFSSFIATQANRTWRSPWLLKLDREAFQHLADNPYALTDKELLFAFQVFEERFISGRIWEAGYRILGRWHFEVCATEDNESTSWSLVKPGMGRGIVQVAVRFYSRNGLEHGRNPIFSARKNSVAFLTNQCWTGVACGSEWFQLLNKLFGAWAPETKFILRLHSSTIAKEENLKMVMGTLPNSIAVVFQDCDNRACSIARVA